MVRNGLVFHKESLDMGPFFVQKYFEMGPISWKLKKRGKNPDKITSFEVDMVENPFKEMDSIFFKKEFWSQ